MSTATAVHALKLQFLAWVDERPRTRADVMEAWRSSCPRLSIWEDCVLEGLVRQEPGGTMIVITDEGRKLVRRQVREEK
jgi:hypothetical protein